MLDATATFDFATKECAGDDRVVIYRGLPIHVGRASFKDSLRAPRKDNFHFQNSHLLKSHAIVEKKEAGFCVQDTRSTFGTILNDHFLLPGFWFPLSAGDVLGFIISKPSSTVNDVVQKHKGEMEIPVSRFSSPEIGMRFKVSFPNTNSIRLTRLFVHEDSPAVQNGDFNDTIDCSEEDYISEEDHSELFSKEHAEDSLSSKSVHFDDPPDRCDVCDYSDCESYSQSDLEEDDDYEQDHQNEKLLELWSCVDVHTTSKVEHVEPALLQAAELTETATTVPVPDKDQVWGEVDGKDETAESVDLSADEDSGPEVDRIVKTRVDMVALSATPIMSSPVAEHDIFNESESVSEILEDINKPVTPIIEDLDTGKLKTVSSEKINQKTEMPFASSYEESEITLEKSEVLEDSTHPGETVADKAEVPVESPGKILDADDTGTQQISGNPSAPLSMLNPISCLPIGKHDSSAAQSPLGPGIFLGAQKQYFPLRPFGVSSSLVPRPTKRPSFLEYFSGPNQVALPDGDSVHPDLCIEHQVPVELCRYSGKVGPCTESRPDTMGIYIQDEPTSRKRKCEAVTGEEDNAPIPGVKKQKVSRPLSATLKEVGKGLLYVVGTFAALAVYGSTIAPQE